MIKKIAVKILSSVEVDRWASNQHEFNGVTAVQSVFGYEQKELCADFHFLSNHGKEEGQGKLTWYDARANHPSRTEYRLYYSTDFPLEKARAGDTMIVVLREDGSMGIYIIEDGTRLVDYIFSVLRSRVDDSYRIISDEEMYALQEFVE